MQIVHESYGDSNAELDTCRRPLVFVVLVLSYLDGLVHVARASNHIDNGVCHKEIIARLAKSQMDCFIRNL
jgi:hypothetical protein